MENVYSVAPDIENELVNNQLQGAVEEKQELTANISPPKSKKSSQRLKDQK